MPEVVSITGEIIEGNFPIFSMSEWILCFCAHRYNTLYHDILPEKSSDFASSYRVESLNIGDFVQNAEHKNHQHFVSNT